MLDVESFSEDLMVFLVHKSDLIVHCSCSDNGLFKLVFERWKTFLKNYFAHSRLEAHQLFHGQSISHWKSWSFYQWKVIRNVRYLKHSKLNIRIKQKISHKFDCYEFIHGNLTPQLTIYSRREKVTMNKWCREAENSVWLYLTFCRNNCDSCDCWIF